MSAVLESLHRQIPGCACAVEIDTDLGLTLAIVPDDALSHDEQRALCEMAMTLMESGPAIRLEESVRQLDDQDNGAVPYFDELVVVENGKAYVFVRQNEIPSRLFCAIGPENGDLADFIDAMTSINPSLDASE